VNLYELFVKLSCDGSDLNKGLGVAKGNLGKFAQDAEGFGSQLAKALPFAAIGAAAYSAAQKFQDAEFTIRRATGATGADLEALSKSFQTVYVSTAKSAEDVSHALAKLNVETKLTGKALEDLTSYNLKFAKVTGQDTVQAIEGTQTALKGFGIEGRAQQGALDDLYHVMQATAIPMAKLEAGMVSAGPAMRALGFSFKETAIVVGNFEEKGLAVDGVMGALQRGFVKLAASTNDPKKAFLEIVERMQKTTTAAEAINIAAEVFGKRGAVVLADSVRKAAWEVGELTKQVDANKDNVGKAADETVRYADILTKWYHSAEVAANKSQGILIALGVIGFAYSTLSGKVATAAVAIGASLFKIQEDVKWVGTESGKAWKAFIAATQEVPLVTNPFAGFVAVWVPSFVMAIKVTMDAIDALKERYKNTFGYISSIPFPWSPDELPKPPKGAAPPPKGGLIVPWTKGEGGDVTGGLGVKVTQPQSAVALTTAELKEIEAEYEKMRKDAEDAYNRSHLEFEARSADAWKLAQALQDAAFRQKLLDDDFAEFGATVPDITGKLTDYANVWAGPDMKAAPNQVEEITAAFVRQNVVTQGALDAVAKQAVADYNLIEKSGIYTMAEITRFWLASERAQIAATLAKGGAVSEEYKRMLNQIELDLNNSLNVQGVAVVNTTASMNHAWSALGQNVRKMMDDISKGIAALIVDGGKFRDVFLAIAKDIAKSIIELLVKVALAEVIKSLGSILDKAGAIGKAIEKWGASITGSAAKSAGDTNSGWSTGGGGGSGGSGGGGGDSSSGFGSVMGIVGDFAAVGTTISSIIGNFQNARQENTLNAIEHNTRYAQIHQEEMLTLFNATLPGIQSLYDYTTTVIKEYLKQIRDASLSFVGVKINVTTGSEEANALLNSLLQRAQTTEYTTGDLLAEQANTMLGLSRIVTNGFRDTIKTISQYGEMITGQLRGQQKSTLEKVLSAGALFGSAGINVGGALGSTLGGLFSSLFGGGDSKDLGRIEENTRYTSLTLQGVHDMADKWWPKLYNIDQYNWNVQGVYLQKICAAVESIDQKGGSGKAAVTSAGLKMAPAGSSSTIVEINVNGSSDVRAVAKEVMSALRRAAPSVAYA
jgi:phage-related minor tail protein